MGCSSAAPVAAEMDSRKSQAGDIVEVPWVPEVSWIVDIAVDVTEVEGQEIHQYGSGKVVVVKVERTCSEMLG